MSRRSYRSYDSPWPEYVPQAARRLNARKHAERLAKKGQTTSPVTVEGRDIARSFWGRAWCRKLEGYGDFSNRLPRGRTYVRNGSVIDLRIGPGSVEALVSGSAIYSVKVAIQRLRPAKWKILVGECAGRIASLIEILQGTLSKGVLEALIADGAGLFPAPGEIGFSCSCPDFASMCKHVAATLYGVGARFDSQPELFFTLRQVDAGDLVAAASESSVLAPAAAPVPDRVLSDADLGAVFGIELEGGTESVAATMHPQSSAEVSDRTGGRPRGRAPSVPEGGVGEAAPAQQHPPRVERAKGKRSAPRKADDRSALEILLRPGATITTSLLLSLGVPRSTFQNWRSAGVLSSTGQRGHYLATRSTAARVRAVLLRARSQDS